MHLLECLTRMPFEHLSRISHAAGLDPKVTQRTVMETELARCLTDRARLQGMLSDLSDEEWAALKVVHYNGGAQGITVELCHQIVNLLSGKRRKSPARAVDDLLHRGLIYHRTLNYRQVYFIPDDLFAALAEILGQQMVARVCIDPPSGARLSIPERDLMEDLLRFVAYVFRTEVTLTQQGQIFKRHLRNLLVLLGGAVDDEEAVIGRYPEPLALLMGFALDRHLLTRSNGYLQASDHLQAWLDRAPGAMQLDIYQYWHDRYFYQDLQAFLSVMRLVGEQWISVDLMVTELEPLINPSQRGSFMLRLRHHLTSFLAPMRVIELSQVGDGDQTEMFCRLTPSGVAILAAEVPEFAPDPHLPFLLQATFEILAPRPVASDLLWNLELIGDLVGRTDRTLTYRLSRQSVYRALKTGKSGESIIAFLRGNSSTGMPQNVAFDLQVWVESYGQVFLQQVMLLRCTSEILAEQVKASRRTSRFVLGQISPVDLIVDEDQYRDLLEALEADGLMPRPHLVRQEKQDA